MPTPSETLHAIKGAAEVNAAALQSIEDEIPPWLAAVDEWNPTPMKGRVRDQLARTFAAYEDARVQAVRLADVSSQAIDEIGTGGDPDILPPSVPWSTGELQISFGWSARPSAGKEIGDYLVVENITWDDVISAAKARVPATGSADVTFWTGGEPIVIFHWDAGDLDATVTVLVAESVPGDIITTTAPDPQDATLNGVAGTLVGRRLGT